MSDFDPQQSSFRTETKSPRSASLRLPSTVLALDYGLRYEICDEYLDPKDHDFSALLHIR